MERETAAYQIALEKRLDGVCGAITDVSRR